MSLHPNITINSQEAPPAGATATDTGTGFMTAICERGAAVPQAVRSLAEFESKFGEAIASGYGHVSAEAFFRMGGSLLWVSPVWGPSSASASVKLFDQSGSVDPGDVSLIVTANSPGEWANGAAGGLSVEVETAGVTAGSFVLIVRRNAVEVERSPELADRAAAVAWAASSDYITITLGASNEDPRDASAANLAGGLADIASITETEWTAALARFNRDLGPGRVFAPGRTTTAAHTALLAHARDNDRTARLDVPNSATVATVAAAGTGQRALATNRYGGLFGPWGIAPGTTAGTTRTVPFSAVQAGLEARNLAAGIPEGQAAAGVNGKVPWLLGLAVNDSDDPLTTQWTDANLDTLHSAGVNVARRVRGTIQTMGYRTMADETSEPQYVDLAGMNLLQRTAAQVREMLGNLQFGRIDGKGHFFKQIEAETIGILKPYFQAGELYGSSEGEAFAVDVGPSVNTSATIAAREAHVVYALKTSPTAEQMVGTHIKVATEGSVS